MPRSRFTVNDPYLESLGRNPLLRGPIRKKWHHKLVRIGIIWSVIAMIIALSYIIYLVVSGA